MKKHFILSFFVFSFSILHAQKNPAFEGIVIPASYDKLGAIKGIAGIIDDNIYVIENDFGGKFDMNNNIKTSIAIVSLQKGNLVKRVFLNDMVAQSGKVVNKILFCDVVAWKNQLFGFYTYKHPGGKEFPANAIILNAMENSLQRTRKLVNSNMKMSRDLFYGKVVDILEGGIH